MKRLLSCILGTAALLLGTATGCIPEEEDYFLRWMLLNDTDTVLYFAFGDGMPFAAEPGAYRLLGAATLPPDAEPDAALLFERHPEYRTLSVSVAPDGPPLRTWKKAYGDAPGRQFFDSTQWADENRDSHDCDYIFRITPEDIADE
ncbi:MAG TPA: hypothetical protein H9866_06655 [Candidatus Tidjanibacter gallistercoris]|nr:hypothetical protein [Candidatus Tidjanibacter gallistercoris]